MYRIAVCEDEPNLREGPCAQCREIMTGLGVEHEIVPFISAEEPEEALQTCLHQNDQPETVSLQGGGKIAVLPLADIRYVESQNHGCVFYMVQGERPFPISLTQAEQMLQEDRFCRCHNGYLVNLAQIKEVVSREVLLFDGRRLPIGRRYAERFQRQFVSYLNLNGY